MEPSEKTDVFETIEITDHSDQPEPVKVQELPKKPLLWSRLSVAYPKRTCCFAMLVPLIATGIIAGTGSFSLDNPSGSDYVIRGDIRTLLSDAREAALEQFPFDVPGSTGQTTRSVEAFSYDLVILLSGKVAGGELAKLNETDDKAVNILSREGMAQLKKAEDAILEHEDFKKFCFYDENERDCEGNVRTCALPWSILNDPNLYGINNPENKTCGRQKGADPVSAESWTKFLDSLFVRDENQELRVQPIMSGLLGVDLTPQNRRTWIAKSIISVGVPFEGFKDEDDRSTEQEDLYVQWAVARKQLVISLSTDKFDLFLNGGTLANVVFGDIALRDLSFSIAAIVLVFIVIWIHTGSAYLSGTAMAQIFLSFPLAYAVYHFIFRQLYFAALQILAIFLLLGIGADDVFVFTDAWKQSEVVLGTDAPIIQRMDWTYRRAVKAMGVTSFTTAAAFFVTATSPIMPIGTLGIWAGTLILFQYALVITMYPCAIIIWNRFWRPRLFVRGFKKPSAGEAEYELNLPFYQRLLPKKWRMKPEDIRTGEYRAVEMFFRGPWVKLVARFKYVLVVLAVALAAVSIYLASRLQPPEENEEFLPPNHPIRIAYDVEREAFPASDIALQLRVRVTWGIKGIDRSGTSKFEPNVIGRAILDESFDFRSAEAQQHMKEACNFFGNNKEIIFQGGAIEREDVKQCWIEAYGQWRISQDKQEFETFATGEEQVKDILAFGNFQSDDGSKPNIKYLQDQHVAFSSDQKKVVFSEIRFVSPMEVTAPYKIMWPVYNKWQDELTKLKAIAPDGVKSPFATAAGGSWKWMITQRTLVRSMFVGIGVMLGVAVVVLTFSTLNWVVSILATLSIGGIVATLLGVIYLLGWELGIAETVGVVISVGYSFDGAAHIATAYVESKSLQRFERTRDALTDLGISILFGAISTLAAGLMLFPAIITFFVTFAGLIVATISLGLIWSLIFFPALLLIVGPAGDFGSLKPFFGKVFGCFRRRKSGAEGNLTSTEGSDCPSTSNLEDDGTHAMANPPTAV